ncbi:MAG: hypothetical protein PHD02_01935 [Bacilli bacterium]|nr:hypothetical protein [Bacilli bacterium]
MKRIFIVILLLLVSGCSVVRIDTSSINNTINVVLSKNNQLFNRIGKGYKYYVPRDVNYIDNNELNDKLYSNGNYYYLYIDVISYYYKKSVDYVENDNSYYSKKIDYNDKEGYVEINQMDSGQFLVEFMYNYAKIEALVNEEDINDVILNASYILSTIKFNDNIIRLMLDNDYLVNQEEKYDIFTSVATTNKFLEYPSEEE